MSDSDYSNAPFSSIPHPALSPLINPLAEDPFENENYLLAKAETENNLHGFYYADRLPVILDCGEVMMTKQEFKDECDIENILKQFSKTGIIEHITKQEAQWLELPDAMDYQQSLETMRQAQEAFESLPSVVREKYDNNPERFLEALHDPSQKDYLTEVGIFAPKWVKDAAPPAASPAAAAAAAGATPTS